MMKTWGSKIAGTMVETLVIRIIVPFAYQTSLSGINDKSIHEVVWYARSFTVPTEWKDSDLLLNFGAVDYEAKVWVNGQEVGSHQGGHVPFQFDIAPFVHEGENRLTVRVKIGRIYISLAGNNLIQDCRMLLTITARREFGRPFGLNESRQFELRNFVLLRRPKAIDSLLMSFFMLLQLHGELKLMFLMMTNWSLTEKIKPISPPDDSIFKYHSPNFGHLNRRIFMIW